MARVAVVTGGTRGIGKAIAVALKNAGYTVAANYGSDDAAAEQFQNETGIRVFKFNVGDFHSCQEGVAKIEAAEPAIGEVQFDLFAQLPLEADAVAVTDDEHPDHQLGVDRRAADLAVEGLQLLPKLSQNPRHRRIDAA